MNAQDLFDAVTDIRDDLITAARYVPAKPKQPMRKRGLRAIAAVLAVILLGGIFLHPEGRLSAYAIAQTEYPEMAHFPGAEDANDPTAEDLWWDEILKRAKQPEAVSSLQDFFARSTPTLLSGAEGENRVCSPLNIYMALSMLAQLTGGESREQLLALLGSDSAETLRRQAGDIWDASYWNDGVSTTIPANSFWLNEDINFHQEVMDILARDFYASSYRGKMGSKPLNDALQTWLQEQTGALLETGKIRTKRETILALASTVSFHAKWIDTFQKEETVPQTFHTPAGDVTADFMHQENEQIYYWGEKFSAVSKSFVYGSGSMWFLLPDEGVTPEELLSDAEAMGFLFTADKFEWEKQKFLTVRNAVPKFDVSSYLDLREGLKALGVTDIFDPLVSDFTPMSADTEVPIILSQADHTARVTIDEEGCTAAAFAFIANEGWGGAPDEEVDFVLDRPFLFCITSDSGLPLFVGVVNTPVG